ncbi:MAG: FtsH protease activity modulator HflK [Planctomycetes bacterium]|nr:FtsH protease activity modulator HflK [Planctomycetota bacterium]
MSRPPFQTGGPDWSKLRLLKVLVPLALLLVGLFTTYYTVPYDSVGVVQRFGRYSHTAEPGLHFKLPFGVDVVTTLAVRRQLKLEFGTSPDHDSTNPDQVGAEPEKERAMVTGDLNAVLVEWVVQYHIADPRLWLFHVHEPGQTLRDLGEAVLREVVGDRTVDEVITVGRQEIEVAAVARLGELAKFYQLGIGIDQVQLKNVNPPKPVQASFNEVNKAQQDRENMINVANGEYNKAVPRAEGEAEQKLSEAEGYRQKRVNEALGDVAAFNAQLAQYSKAPQVTRTRLYLETMKEVLPALADTWIVDASVTQLLPMLQGKAQGGGK